MKNILLFCYCLFQINVSIGQIKKIPKESIHFLFTFKSDTYLLDNDFVYNLTSTNDLDPIRHNLAFKEFKFLNDEKVGYLKNASSGIVYSFDGKNLIRLDNSFDFKSQFRSFSFIHNKMIFDFGG